MGLGHWPLPYSPFMRVSLVLASGCQSQEIIAAAASGFEGIDNMRCTFAKVLAIASWDSEGSEPEYRKGLRRGSREVVVPELVFEPD